MKRLVFLTAEWRDIVLLNFPIAPELLKQYLPKGTELDFFEGETFVSIVAFRFLNTRVLGIPIPFHINFDEVNLRFYVRRRVDSEWRRGVAFIRELVPRAAIAHTARIFFGEPYLTLPISHQFEAAGNSTSYRYEWRTKKRANFVQAKVCEPFENLIPGSREEFIMEHYWGYTGHKDATNEYEVEHPRWQVAIADSVEFQCDVAKLFGEQFVSALGKPPAFTFVANGSAVKVRYRTVLRSVGDI